MSKDQYYRDITLTITNLVDFYRERNDTLEDILHAGILDYELPKKRTQQTIKSWLNAGCKIEVSTFEEKYASVLAEKIDEFCGQLVELLVECQEKCLEKCEYEISALKDKIRWMEYD